MVYVAHISSSLSQLSHVYSLTRRSRPVHWKWAQRRQVMHWIQRSPGLLLEYGSQHTKHGHSSSLSLSYVASRLLVAVAACFLLGLVGLGLALILIVAWILFKDAWYGELVRTSDAVDLRFLLLLSAANTFGIGMISLKATAVSLLLESTVTICFSLVEGCSSSWMSVQIFSGWSDCAPVQVI